MAGGRGVAVSLVVTACAGAVCCVDAVAAADAGVKQIALVPNATELEGFDGRLVWSRKDPSTKRFVLMTHYRGRVSKVPVASRVSAFDVDLGPDRAGRTVAVYSRCRGAAGEHAHPCRSTAPASSSTQAGFGAERSGAETRIRHACEWRWTSGAPLRSSLPPLRPRLGGGARARHMPHRLRSVPSTLPPAPIGSTSGPSTRC